MVWYNYRRVPAVTLAKQAHRRGQARQHLPLPGQVPAGLDHHRRPAAGRRGLWRLDVAAAGSGVTGDLLAHCIDTRHLAQRRHRQRHRHDRDLRQGAQAQPDRQGARRSASTTPAAFMGRFANGSLGTFESTRYARGHKAALHLRDQRREGLDRLGPARPAPPAILRPPRRRRRCAAGPASTSPTAIIRTWASGGCRACTSATSTASSTRSPTSSKASKTGKPAAPTFRDALETNKLCDAIIASGKSGQWINV